jgi:hypothetical protein
MSGVTSVQILDNASTFGITLEHSFQVYQTHPLRRKFLKDFVNSRVAHITLTGDGATVAFSATPLARGQCAERVLIWSNQSGEGRSQLEFAEPVLGLSLSPRYLLILLSESAIVYDFDHARALSDIVTAPSTGAGAISGGRIAVCGLQPGFISVSDVLDGTQPTIFRAHDHPISRIRLSPDGATVATASHKGTLIRLFDCASGRQLAAFRRGAIPGAIVAIAISQSNQEVVVVSAKGTVHFFTVAAAREGGGEPVRAVAKASIGKVEAADVAFAQDGGIVVIASRGFLFRIKWEAAALEVVECLFILTHE